MQKAKATLQDETIKELFIQEEPDTVDVRQSVMDRVRELHERRSGKKTVRHRTGTIVMITCLILVLTSLTGYAASRYVQILNSKGEVIVETKEIREDKYTPHAKTFEKLLSAYKEHVQTQLKPGELVAYYVHDETLNAYDKFNKVKTEYKPLVYSSYAELKQQLEITAGPLLPEPQYLPKGFAFAAGKVFPSMTEGEASLDQLKKLEPEFIRMAESSSNGTKLFIKPLSWNKAGSANVSYAKGEDTININAFVRKKHLSSVVSMHPHGVFFEKLTAGGQEMVYMEAEAEAVDKVNYKHKLEWLDEDAEVFYSVYDNPGSTLSKSEFIRIAGSMVK
ncbi:DUF4367 domain-containing protein [Paenibacillus oralis]|uniref:DUF4367 domain-containing protein n=1 Tax=Paenibacillus oralis TaxID=2490856 RepID=A0A3P3U733_9BACL|nr:DUF4367 domain-containing protein [Paenibacillus oralis]RRJ65984.1 DUF4367 domain-containing protein [Paenibacillus oralis]